MSRIKQFIDILNSSKTLKSRYSNFLNYFANQVSDLKCGKMDGDEFIYKMEKKIDEIINETNDKDIVSLFTYIKVLCFKLPATVEEEMN